jgi:hypothetical protein
MARPLWQLLLEDPAILPGLTGSDGSDAKGQQHH